jgi:hypothetical protein
VGLLWIGGAEPAARDGSSRFILDFAPDFAGGFFQAFVRSACSLCGLLPARSPVAPMFWAAAQLMLVSAMAGSFVGVRRKRLPDESMWLQFTSECQRF